MDSQATVKVESVDRKVGIDYALVDINKTVLAYADKTVNSSLSGTFGGGRGGPPQIVLGVGDVVQVAIFEAQSGGLFIPADAGSRPGNYISLPKQTIDREGNITVPYAGKVKASGRPVDQVQLDIASRLANRAIEPQVVISIDQSRSMEASVLGDVKTPKKIELSPAGERILDLISEAGGLSAPGTETTVTLQRRSRSVTVPYDVVSKTPAENIYAQPGDTLIVNRERRTFLAFGVTGESGRYDFDDSNLTLGDALAKAGGLLDDKAEPQAVLVYRIVDKDFLHKIGVNTQGFTSKDVPVIFRANLRDPSGFFMAQKFPMQNKDVIYVSTSPSVEFLKFLTIVNSATSSASNIADTRRSIRNR
ncbi:polysaccharide biosynthesis/export family protein [Rhizobium rhizoryzae]|uniref:Polysaccharide export outer membrane protein n=1 Tax=Rhizobium rhizoryzae TaxID=451876 RepID=A0A7W6LKA0_9HYPH|nr:polysaccharide biosynthesis/export family protein [Rhizobium rhizoryzae]MBB4145925.1 polysaccharide export outer membrane protein [Rhizobium rhizoryzae]